MKNLKLLFPALVPSFIIMIGFIMVGFKVMMKYWNTPGDWHFIAAAIGTVCFMFMLITLAATLVIKIRQEQKVQESDLSADRQAQRKFN